MILFEFGEMLNRSNDVRGSLLRAAKIWFAHQKQAATIPKPLTLLRADIAHCAHSCSVLLSDTATLPSRFFVIARAFFERNVPFSAPELVRTLQGFSFGCAVEIIVRAFFQRNVFSSAPELVHAL